MERHNGRREGFTKSNRHSSYQPIQSPSITTTTSSSSISSSTTTSSTHSPKLRSNKLESSSFRHFHSNPFGQPPGLINKNTTINNNSINNNNNSGGVNDGSTIKKKNDHPYYYYNFNQDHQNPPIPTTSNSSPLLTSSNRVAPLKELQKMITDLKKENFDLKLQLYHLEDTLKKEDNEKIKLINDNKRLNSDLVTCLNQKRELELALDQDIYFLQHEEEEQDDNIYSYYNNNNKVCYDAFTQTINKEEKKEEVESSSLYNHHLFPTDPASFGLLSSRTNINQSSIESFDSIVDQFSNVKLALSKKSLNK